MDYDMEEERRWSVNRIHRYVRVKRFESVLYRLLGLRGEVDPEVVDMMRGKIDTRKEKVWNSVRGWLKKNGYTKYYNLIGSIIQMLGLKWRINWHDNHMKIAEIVRKFKRISSKFDCTYFEKRKYFPNLRFVALKMLHHEGVEFGFHIPYLRTKRELKTLQMVWAQLEGVLCETERQDRELYI